MSVIDIRPIKSELRQKYRSLRQAMPQEIKKQKDMAIAEQVRRLWQYQRNSILLIYVSTSIEVDTADIICRAIAEGKRVAVPRCVPDTRNMEFYYIESLDELSPGMFGVLEPVANPERLYDEKDGGLCIVPAFSYDWRGFRLGYGKGYYDRFLSRFEGNMVGICYSDCVQRSLPHGRYDRPVELLVTEHYLRRTDR